jgi:tRNA(adenine34) deaminase
MKNERLPGATLYVTLEPCVMCMGALLQARIERLVFGTRDFRAGAAGSKINLAQGLGAYASVGVDEGVCQKECESLLTDFFRLKR